MGDLTSQCYQRKLTMLFNTPNPRVTPKNPYLAKQLSDPVNYNFNSYSNELSMRRKAEILSYKNSQQTPGFTKKNQFSKIVNGNYRGKNLFCPQDDTIPTPSSSCGVPGPIVYMYKDDAVPLYNYATNTDSYAIVKSTPNAEWNFYASDNLFFKPYTDTAIEKSIATLIINDNVSTSYLNFGFSTPIAIYATGRDLTNNNFDISFNMAIPPTCKVYFSNKEVTSIKPIVTAPNYTVSLHGSLQNTTYSSYIYYGIINVNNIQLYTEPGFVYDIRLSFPMNINPSDSSVGFNSQFGIYANVSQDMYSSIVSYSPNEYTPKNCIINGKINPSYSTFNGTGVQ
jgi:hypothetical protein